MKRFLRTVLAVCTVPASLVYVAACLTPFISPAHWVGMGFLGMGFPVLLAVLLLLLVAWLPVQRNISLVLLLIVLCGSHHLYHSIGLNKPSFTPQKPAGTVRLMGWNVQNFTRNGADSQDTIPDCCPMYRYIREQDPDIICMQDFYVSANPNMSSSIQVLQNLLGYPYYCFARDYKEYPFWGPNYAGVAIFSKYPLKNVQRIPFSGKTEPNSIITADLTIRNVTRRLVATHLQSMHLKNLPPSEKGAWIVDEDSAINYSGSYYKKLAYYLPYHARQAEELRKVVEESPYPVILSVDMNEVPTSYCYHRIKGSRKDVFLEKGTGLGQTYYRISPTLRIDYLLYSPGIEVVQFKKDPVNLSDHYPQLADFKW